MEGIEAVRLLTRIRQVFDVSVGAYALMTTEPARSELSKYTIRYDENGRFEASASPLSSDGWGMSCSIQFQDADYQPAASDLVERATRHAIVESMDVLQRFTRNTPAWEELEREPWFYFARLYRHAAAHDGSWQFTSVLRAQLPAQFMNRAVDEGMEGQSIEGFLDLFRARQLLATMQLFAQGHRGRT